mgnify:CR=1 FL=1
MNKEERQLYNFIDKFKRHIQSHLQFSPMALSNFHHFSDRLLDKCNGDFEVNFELFRKNIKEMLKDSEPTTQQGINIIDKLELFVKKGKDVNDFINIVYWIYEDYK